MDKLTDHAARAMLAHAHDAYQRGWFAEATETEHRVLCHADGSPCPDNCEADAIPAMIELYNAPLD